MRGHILNRKFFEVGTRFVQDFCGCATKGSEAFRRSGLVAEGE